MTPTLDPKQTHFVLSTRADTALHKLGIGAAHLERRRAMVDAAFDGISAIPESVELQTHFMADAKLGGRDVVLLCVQTPPKLSKKSTTIIQAAYSPADAAELMARRSGSAATNNGLSAGKKTYDDSTSQIS